MANKKYNSVPEMLDGIGMSKKVVKEVSDKINNTEISRCLTVLRTGKNVGEQEMANNLGISKRSLVSLEYKNNDKLKLSDITKYADALGFDVTLNFTPRVKSSKIKSKIIHLTSLFFHKSCKS